MFEETTNLLDKDQVVCEKCVQAVPVKKIQDIKPGDHICYKPASTSFIQKLKRLFYDHHGIVRDEDESKGTITLLHYWKSGGFSKPKLQESEETFDLNMKIMKYRNSNKLEDRLQKADEVYAQFQGSCENRDQQHKYNLVFNNCEHFCHYICVNKKASSQVDRYSRCARHFANYFTLHLILYFIFKRLVLNIHDIQNSVITAVCCLIIVFLIFAVVIILQNERKLFFSYCKKGHFCEIRVAFSRCKYWVGINCKKYYFHCGEFVDKNWCKQCHQRKRGIRWIRFLCMFFMQIFGLSVFGIKLEMRLYFGILWSAITVFVSLMIAPYFLCCEHYRIKYQQEDVEMTNRPNTIESTDETGGGIKETEETDEISENILSDETRAPASRQFFIYRSISVNEST